MVPTLQGRRHPEDDGSSFRCLNVTTHLPDF